MVTLQKKAEEQPSSSYRDELKEEIHELSVQINSNHELYMAKFDAVETLAQVLNHLQTSKLNAQESGEDPSTKGEIGTRVETTKETDSTKVTRGTRTQIPIQTLLILHLAKVLKSQKANNPCICLQF